MNGTLKPKAAAAVATKELPSLGDVQGNVVPSAGVSSWFDAGVRL